MIRQLHFDWLWAKKVTQVSNEETKFEFEYWAEFVVDL